MKRPHPIAASTRTVEAARRRLVAALAPRLTPAQVIVGLCCAILGFGIVATSANRTSGGILQNARTEDLIRILDDLSEREQRIAAEQRELEIAQERLTAGNPDAALSEARDRADALAILAGTAPVTGRGIILRISDPSGVVDSPILLNAVQELRDAGAEAIQVGSVRVVANTWFGDSSRGVLVSGTPVKAPISIRAVGDSATLATAMDIPGGVADTVRAVGGRISVARSDKVMIDAVVLGTSGSATSTSNP